VLDLGNAYDEPLEYDINVEEFPVPPSFLGSGPRQEHLVARYDPTEPLEDLLSDALLEDPEFPVPLWYDDYSPSDGPDVFDLPSTPLQPPLTPVPVEDYLPMPDSPLGSRSEADSLPHRRSSPPSPLPQQARGEVARANPEASEWWSRFRREYDVRRFAPHPPPPAPPVSDSSMLDIEQQMSALTLKDSPIVLPDEEAEAVEAAESAEQPQPSAPPLPLEDVGDEDPPESPHFQNEEAAMIPAGIPPVAEDVVPDEDPAPPELLSDSEDDSDSELEEDDEDLNDYNPYDSSDPYASRTLQQAYYHHLQQQREEARSEEDDDDDSLPYRRQDFAAPPLTDGPWHRSDYVSKLCKDGFNIQVDVTKRGKAPRTLTPSTEEERHYIEQLISDGILEVGDTEFCVPHFFDYKPGKLRLIFDGRKLNAACKPPPKFNQKSHETRARLAKKYNYRAADDLKNMFFTVKIAESSRKYFGIRTSFGTFRYTCLPFGFSWSPFIAHISVDEVVKRAIEAGHAVTHFVDDFDYYGNTPEECIAARDFCRDLFVKAGWRVNHSKYEPPSQRYVSLGVEYDLRLKSSRMPSDTLEQLRRTHLRLKSSHHLVGRRQLASMVGTLVFYNHAHPGSLSHLSPLIAFVNTAGDDWKRRYDYRSFSPFFERVWTSVAWNDWTTLQVHSSSPTHYYTDATNRQLGLVTPNYVASARRPYKQIYRAEADAVGWLLEQPITREACLRIDNEALVNAIKKGRSNIPEANRVVKKIFQLRQRGHVITTKHIRTELNPADAPSRCRVGPRGFLFHRRLP